MALFVEPPPQMMAPLMKPLFQWTFTPHPDWDRVRRRLEKVTAWPGAPRTVRVEHTTLGGVAAELLVPPVINADTTVLYLHGGGFTVGSPRTHRALAGRLAVAMKASTYVLDYRLAPEHPWPAAEQDAVAAYRALLARGIPADRIAVAGDSAGGGLALTVAITARDAGIPAPAVLGLICPGLDISQTALNALPTTSKDIVLSPPLVRSFLTAYTNGFDGLRPSGSPLHAALAGLPPIVIDTASNDLIVSQSRELAARARAAGVTVHYTEHRGLWHVFHALAGVLPQATRALRHLAQEMVRYTNPASATPIHGKNLSASVPKSGPPRILKRDSR
jgi:acetyl esterase/lipase